jgi:homoaconitate hydratase
VSHGRAWISTGPRSQYAFHSQLESIPNAEALSSSQPPPTSAHAQTLTEKIVQRYSTDLAPGKKVKAGDYVTLKPNICMTHDNSFPVAMKFMQMGASKIRDKRQIIMVSIRIVATDQLWLIFKCLDHDVQNETPANLKKYSLG